MIEDYRDSIKRNFGFFPNTLEIVFPKELKGDSLTISYEYFQNSLKESLNNVKFNKLERYSNIARIVFCFINLLLEIRNKQNFNDKFKFLINGGKIQNQLNNLSDYICRIFSDLYDIPQMTSIEINEKIDDFFILKKKSKKHTQTIENFSDIFSSQDFLEKNKVSEYLNYVRNLELIIYGIDDYVDESFPTKEDVFLNVASVSMGLINIANSLIKEQRFDIKNNFSFLLTGKKTKMEKITDALAKSLIELTNVPFSEENTKNLSNINNNKKEIQLAIDNIDTRASVMNVYLNFADVFFSKENDVEFAKLKELLRSYRAVELLNKDIDDIDNDIKNSDWRPANVWAIKYSKGDKYCKRIEILTNYYKTKTKMIYSSIESYKKPANICFNKIENEIELIGDKI
jgi:hypothetical protein